MIRVAVLDDYLGIARTMADWSALPDEFAVDVFEDHLADEDAVARRLEPYQVIFALRERTPFPRSLIERLPNLRLLVTAGARNRAVDIQACNERQVPVCGTGTGAAPTAELTWGLILAVTKGIVAEDRGVRDGKWGVGLGIQLEGRTLGVIGLGKLGSKVARIGLAMGMRVVAWSQNLTAERAAEVGVDKVALDELLSGADVVTIHTVLSSRTRGLLGARELGLMRPDAYLVNTSRGPIVDEAALIAVLQERRIAGAGLDVFDVEPLPPEHPFRWLPNIVVTPHLGGFIRENYRLWYSEAVEDIIAWHRGQPIRQLEPPAS